MERVAAVIVAFNNCEMLRDLLNDLYTQVRVPDNIIVIDNASTDPTGDMVKSNFGRTQYIRLNENSGSAGGYHEGLKLAIKNCDFVWTFDDDVRLKPNSLSELLEGFRALNATYKIGAVRCVGEHHPIAVPTEMDIITWRGTLIKIEAILAAGLPRKEYFIYGEDIDFSYRMKKQGYVFYWIPKSQCIERRQGKTDRRLFGREVKIYRDSFRFYYAFRNEINIYLQYRRIRELYKTVLYAMKVAVFILVTRSPQKRATIYAIFQGILDGITGNLGIKKQFLPSK
jgi:GT2 family glycosyltransferase